VLDTILNLTKAPSTNISRIETQWMVICYKKKRFYKT